MSRLYHYKHIDEKEMVQGLLAQIEYGEERKISIKNHARELVEYVRGENKNASLLQKFVQEYDLTSEAG